MGPWGFMVYHVEGSGGVSFFFRMHLSHALPWAVITESRTNMVAMNSIP